VSDSVAAVAGKEARMMPLLEHHRAKCAASRLSDETIRAAGLRSETDHAKLAVLLGWPKAPKKIAPALVFPYTSADGSNGYARIRPDKGLLIGEENGTGPILARWAAYI
jgi:hypothetical protein